MYHYFLDPMLIFSMIDSETSVDNYYYISKTKVYWETVGHKNFSYELLIELVELH